MALEWLDDKTYEITPKQAARDIVELLTTIRTRYQHSDPDVVDLLALVDRLREGYEDALELLDATQRALIEVAHQRNQYADAIQQMRLTVTTSAT